MHRPVQFRSQQSTSLNDSTTAVCVQNTAARLVLGLNHRAHTTPALRIGNYTAYLFAIKLPSSSLSSSRMRGPQMESLVSLGWCIRRGTCGEGDGDVDYFPPIKLPSKTATLMHSILHHRSPSYLSDLVRFATADPSRSRLWLSTARAATILRTSTKLGDWASFVAAWNT